MYELRSSLEEAQKHRLHRQKLGFRTYIYVHVVFILQVLIGAWPMPGPSILLSVLLMTHSYCLFFHVFFRNFPYSQCVKDEIKKCLENQEDPIRFLEKFRQENSTKINNELAYIIPYLNLDCLLPL